MVQKATGSDRPARRADAKAPAKKAPVKKPASKKAAGSALKVRFLSEGVTKMAVVEIYSHTADVFEFEHKKPRSGSTVRVLIPASDLVALAYEKGVQIAYVRGDRVAFKEVTGTFVKSANGFAVFNTEEGEVQVRAGNYRAWDADAKM